MCNPVTTGHPELLLAQGVHRGYEWEVTNNGMGFRCGYVRIPLGHPWHGGGDELDVTVHGGLTFYAHDADCGKGAADADWWLGFDCGHFLDLPDPSLGEHAAELAKLWMAAMPGSEIRSTEYVADECRRLIDQAAAQQG
jgi:hypothetical protein